MEREQAREKHQVSLKKGLSGQGENDYKYSKNCEGEGVSTRD